MTESLLEHDLAKLASMKDELRKMEASVKAYEQEVVATMQSRHVRAWAVDHEHWVRASLVQSSTVSINERELKNRLTDEQWQSVTTTVLDHKALEHEIAEGRIEISVVAECSTESLRRPYIRFGGSVTKET